MSNTAEAARAAPAVLSGPAGDGPPLRVLSLNTTAWGPRRTTWTPGQEPDPFGLDRRLREAHNIAFELLDPNPRPLNPFAGRSPMLEGIDPARALRVLLGGAGGRRADILACACEGPAWLPLLLRRAALYRPPVLLCDPILGEGWKWRDRLLDATVPRADAVTFISSFQRDYVARRWGRTEGVHVVGYGVDSDFWRAPPPPADGPVVAVGQDHSRDYPLLLEAWGGLPEAGRPGLRLRTSLVAEGTPLPAGVEVLRQRLTDQGLRDLYASARFVAMPLKATLNAGGVTSILEAMNCGRALVVGDNPVIRDFLRPGETCLAVPPGDVRAFRDACAKLIAEPGLCAAMGAAARRLVEERFSPDAYAARFAAVLRGMVAARRA